MVTVLCYRTTKGSLADDLNGRGAFLLCENEKTTYWNKSAGTLGLAALKNS